MGKAARSLFLRFASDPLPHCTYVGFSNDGAAALGGPPSACTWQLHARTTSVRLLATASVQDLKAALCVYFPPVQATSVFHLSSTAASSSSTSSSPASLLPGGVHLLPPVLHGGFTPSSRPPRRVHLFPPVLRGGKLILDPKLASISLVRGEFISLIWSSPLPVCRRQAPTASTG
jgi:hypothetical protein